MDEERVEGDYLLMGIIALNGADAPREGCKDLEMVRIGAAVYNWTDLDQLTQVALDVKGEDAQVCVYLCKDKAMALARLIVAAAKEISRGE
jgi:hypothetical protein